MLLSCVSCTPSQKEQNLQILRMTIKENININQKSSYSFNAKLISLIKKRLISTNCIALKVGTKGKTQETLGLVIGLKWNAPRQSESEVTFSCTNSLNVKQLTTRTFTVRQRILHTRHEAPLLLAVNWKIYVYMIMLVAVRGCTS